ncbi:MAG: ABC transporter permease, partial [Agrococcus casei]
MSEQLAKQAAPPPPEGEEQVDRSREFMQRLMTGTPMLSVLAVVASLVLGALLIAFTDERVAKTAGYFFARPTDMLQALWDSVAGAYTAMFQGSILNINRIDTLQQALTPVSNTFYYAAPLIIAGLGVAIAFKVGLFNIGGQ